MEKVKEIRAQLANYKEASTSEEVRADCFIADIALESFEEFLKKRLHYREIHVEMCRNRNSASYPVLQGVQVPQLFHNNIPVRKLFLRNIKYRINKVILFECLSNQDCRDFEVINVKAIRKGSVAVIKCATIASACEIQVKACKKELIFTDPNGIVSIIRVRPDQFTTQNALQPAQTSINVLKDVPNHLASFLNNSIPTSILFEYLSSNDIFNFYSACYEDSRFLHLKVPFDANCDRYKNANGLNLLLMDARTFKFRSISFGLGCGRFQTPFVNKFLLTCSIHASGPRNKMKMDYIDLTGILASFRTIELLSESFETEKLTLGQTPGGCDQSLDLKNLVSISLRNNDQLSLKFLEKQCFAHLVSLQIIDCNEVPIEKLCNYVASNQSLRKLVFIDSQSKIGHTVQLSEAALSGKNILEIFKFSYTAVKLFRTELIPQLSWINSDKIREINLTNNDYFTEYVSEILFKLPNLRIGNIQGLDLFRIVNFTLDLSNLKLLNVLKISYFPNINILLHSLMSTQVKSIFIVNKLGKKKTRAIDSCAIRNLFVSREQFLISLTKCKISIDKRMQVSLNIKIKQLNDTVTFYKRCKV
ncbi:uncharacterized protein [Prorops nasuta]|uniref:uncharacterized protein n=1 Tax=Prorops nasuta TaxID=863751 RepID=UPI0034CFB36B